MSNLQHLIDAATDCTLTSDNWQYIMDVTDAINNGDPETSTKEAIKMITKRFDSRDANVLLRTCLLVLALAENCGSRMKQEIATKQFCLVLLGKMSDKKVHYTVKESVASLIYQLDNLFKSDSSLKPMADAGSKIQKSYAKYLSHQETPTKPAKKELTKLAKLKEEEEWQEAIRLSLEDSTRKENMKKNLVDKATFDQQGGPIRSNNNKNNNHNNTSKLQNGDLPPVPTISATSTNTQMKNEFLNEEEDSLSIANISKVRALYDLNSYEPEELSFKKGDIIKVIESVYNDWWKGSLPNGETGIFPLNYVAPVIPKTANILAHEAEAENKVLYGGTMLKVDRLLALLTNPDVSQVDEEEVTSLYNELIPLRPMLLKSIEKYNERNEELKNLTASVNQTVKVYNQMVDDLSKQRMSTFTTGSMGTYVPPPPQQQQQQYPTSSNEQPQYLYNQLNAQPTSAGFGNAPFPQHSGLSNSNTGYIEGNYHFLNVNRFPDVDSMPQ